MEDVSRVYKLNGIKQLIDLNGDSVNFKTKFSVSATCDSKFKLAIADQSMLDNNETLDFKIIDREISGTIEAKDNEKKDYFLILMSMDNAPTDVRVTIEKEELPYNNSIELDTTVTSANRQSNQAKTFSRTTLLLIGVLIVAIIVFIIFMCNKKTVTKNTITKEPVFNSYLSPSQTVFQPSDLSKRLDEALNI
jgi:hypothetical protein